MQTQGLSGGSIGQTATASSALDHRTSTGRGSRVALSAFVVGIAVGAWAGWGMEQIAAPAPAALPASTVQTSASLDAAIEPAVGVTASRRSLAVSMPNDGAYLTSSSIPVAGTAFGRPHGPKVAAVQVELIADGQSMGRAEIPVFSGRFAGIVAVPSLDHSTRAQLRISAPLHQGDKAVVREVTLDPR